MTTDKDHRRSLILAGAVIIALLLVIYWLAGALFPFAITGVLAYALYPVVKNLERVIPWRKRFPNVSRGVAVGLVLLVGAGIIGGILALVIPLIGREVGDFWVSFPNFFRAARLTLEQMNREYANRIPGEIRQSIEDYLASAGDVFAGAIQDAVVRVTGFISSALSLIIGLSVGPIFLYYLLKDHDRIATGLYTPVPSAIRPHLSNVGSIINQTLGAYIRGQLLLGLVVGTLVAVGLFLIGVPFPILLGLVAGITELMPIIGPWLGGAAGLLVTLATAPDKALFVLLLYLGVQLLENSLLVPRIQGDALKLHPIVVLVIIVVGSQLFGLWGIILGPLLVAAARDIIRYFVVEWSRPANVAEPVMIFETSGDLGAEVGTEHDVATEPTTDQTQ